MASLQENRTVLTYLQPVFFQRDLHCRLNDQEKHLQRAVFCSGARALVCGFGPIGEVMAADLYRAYAQPDITGSALEQEVESLHSRAGIEDMDMYVSRGLLIVVPAELYGGGAS